MTAPDSRGGRFVGVNDGWAVWISEGLNSAGQPDRDVKGYNFTTGLTQTLVGGWDVVSTLHVGPNAIYWRSENDTTNEIRIYRMDLEDQVPIEIPWTRGVPALRGVDDGNLLIASGDGIVIHDLAENRTRRVWQDYPIEARINGDWLVWTQSIEGSEHSEVELHAMTVEGRRHNTIEVPVAGSPVVIEGTVYFTGVSPNRVEWKLHRWNSSTDHEEIWTPPGAARSSLDQADAHGHHLVYLRYPPFGIDVVDLANNTAFLAKSGTSENPVIRGRIMAWNTGYSVEITCLDSGLTKLG